MDQEENPTFHIEDDSPRGPDARGLAGIFRPVCVVLTIGLIFVTVYLSAFHAPKPHSLPIVVVGSTEVATHLRQDLNRGLPGGFTVQNEASTADARTAIDDRGAFGGIVVSNDRWAFMYAGANGPPVTNLLTEVIGRAAHASGVRVHPQDVLPPAAGDSRSLSIFYTAFGLVLAGFLFGSATYQTAPRLQLRQRLLSLTAFAVGGGIVIAAVAKGFGALPGSFIGLVAIIALMAAAVGGTSMMLIRVLGGAGVAVGSVILLVLGNSTSGGVLPAEFLPSWLHLLSETLPVGVGVRAIDGVAYFHHDGLVSGVVILAAWIVLCVAVLFLLDGRDSRRAKRALAKRASVRVDRGWWDEPARKDAPRNDSGRGLERVLGFGGQTEICPAVIEVRSE